jgi:acetylornithine deacetylase
LIEFVRDTLSDLGVESVLVADETGAKANLFATAGPEGEAGILALRPYRRGAGGGTGLA